MTTTLAGALATSVLSAALLLAAPAAEAQSQPGEPTPDRSSAPPKKPTVQGKTSPSDGLPHRHRVNKAQRKADQAADAAKATMTGQDAFGAIAQVVRTLEADPSTDWSKVDLEGLRQHLIDMNEVTLNAAAVAKPIEGGLEIAVTGTGRTIGAIQRMVPTHARDIDGLNGWSVKAQATAKGALLKVTSSDAKEVKHIRGLGFIGILVTGSNHQEQHVAVAKGEMARGR